MRRLGSRATPAEAAAKPHIGPGSKVIGFASTVRERALLEGLHGASDALQKAHRLALSAGRSDVADAMSDMAKELNAAVGMLTGGGRS